MNKDYDTETAARVTYENLPKELQEKFTENDVYEILNLKYLAEQEDNEQTGGTPEKKEIDIAEEEMNAIFKAEEAYLKQLGA